MEFPSITLRQKGLGEPYVSFGDADRDRLAFFHVLENLKTQKRTGWLNNDIAGAESISDHMHRMSILALCLEDKEINVMRCALLAAIHDLAEARVGDIAPSDGISKEDKKALEASAMNNFTESMLGGSQSVVSTRIMDLWQEYELQESAEARLVKDLDLFEMALQAMEYEKRGGGEKCLSTFFESSIPRIRHTEVKRWAESLLEERKSFWDGFGKDGSVGGS